MCVPEHVRVQGYTSRRAHLCIIDEIASPIGLVEGRISAAGTRSSRNRRRQLLVLSCPRLCLQLQMWQGGVAGTPCRHATLLRLHLLWF